MMRGPPLSMVATAAFVVHSAVVVAKATAMGGSVGQPNNPLRPRSLQEYDYALYYDDDDDVATTDAGYHDDDYNDDGFVGYVESTRDPGAAFIVATIVLCFASLAVLPCLVVWGDKYERRRKRAKLERQRRERKELDGGDECSPETRPGRRCQFLSALFSRGNSTFQGEDDQGDRGVNDGNGNDGGLNDLHLRASDTDDTAEMMEVSPTNLGGPPPRSTNPFDDPPPPPGNNPGGKNKTTKKKKRGDSSTFRYEVEATPNTLSKLAVAGSDKQHETVHNGRKVVVRQYNSRDRQHRRQYSKDSLDDLVGKIDGNTNTGTGGTLSDDRSLSSGIQRAIDTIVIPPYPSAANGGNRPFSPHRGHHHQRRGKRSKQQDCNRSVVSSYSHDNGSLLSVSSRAQSINSFVELTLNAVPRKGHRGGRTKQRRAPPAQRARRLRKDIENETRISAMDRVAHHHHRWTMEDQERGRTVQSHSMKESGVDSKRGVPQAAAENGGPNKQQHGGNATWGWLHNMYPGSPRRQRQWRPRESNDVHHQDHHGEGDGTGSRGHHGDVKARTQIWHQSRSNANNIPPPPPAGKTGDAYVGNNILFNPLGGVIGKNDDGHRGGSIPPPPKSRRHAPPGGGSGSSQQGPPPPPPRCLRRASTGGDAPHSSRRLRRSTGGGDFVPSAIVVPPTSIEEDGGGMPPPSSSEIVARALARNAAAWEVRARARARSASPAFNNPANAATIDNDTEIPDQLKPQLAPQELIVAKAKAPPPPPPLASKASAVGVPESISLPINDSDDGDLIDDDGDISKLSQARYLSPRGDFGGDHDDDYSDKDDCTEELDVCCGPNPIFSRRYLSIAFDNLIELLDTDRESKRIIRLAVPMTTSEILETVFDAVQISLVAKHLGTDSVAAMAMADVFVGMTEEFLRGIIDGQVSITSHAIGVGNNYLAGQYVQLSAMLYTLASVPEFVVWWWAIAPATMWLGLNARVAQIAQKYARVLLFAEWLDAMSECLHGIYEVTDHEVYSTIVTLIEGCIGVAMTAVAVTSIAGIELYHIAIFDIGVGVVFLIVNFLYPWRKGWLRPFIPGMFHNLAFRNRNALWNMVRTSGPLAFGQLLAYGEWEVLTIFCAHLGPAEVATWALMGYIWETFEASTEGIGDASEIRVSYHLGKGNPQMAKIASYKCITMAMIFATFVTSIFFIIGDDLPRLMTNDPTIQHLMSELTPLVGVGNLTMTFGMVSWALIGAQGRYSLATKVATFCSWGITIPLASIFVYGFRFDLQGVTSAVVLGYSFCGMILAYILLRSNWSKLSLIVQEINAITGEVDSSDEDSDDDDSSDSSDSSFSSSDNSSCSSSDSSLSAVSRTDMKSSYLRKKSTLLTSNPNTNQ